MIVPQSINIDTETDIEKLRAICKTLIIQNGTLMCENGVLHEKMKEYEAKQFSLMAELSTFHAVEEQNKQLRLLVDELKKENELLKVEKNQMVEDIKTMKMEIAELKLRDEPITVREAMRALEGSICYEACGSKAKYKKYFCFTKMSSCSDKDVVENYNRILNRLHFDEEHLDEIVFLKEQGNVACHRDRPAISFAGWKKLMEEGAQEESEKSLRSDLLSALKGYFPIADDDEPWRISFTK
eukprot:gene2376-2608_t